MAGITSATLLQVLHRYGIAVLQDTLSRHEMYGRSLSAHTVARLVATCRPLGETLCLSLSETHSMDVFESAIQLSVSHASEASSLPHRVVVILVPNDAVWARIDQGWPLNLMIVLVIGD